VIDRLAAAPRVRHPFRAKECRGRRARHASGAAEQVSATACGAAGLRLEQQSSWSACWWLLSWPSGRAPTTAARLCDSSRPRAARGPARVPARSKARERHVLAYRARILRPASSWPLSLSGKRRTWTASDLVRYRRSSRAALSAQTRASRRDSLRLTRSSAGVPASKTLGRPNARPPA
jgi:hypothetical protein